MAGVVSSVILKNAAIDRRADKLRAKLSKYENTETVFEEAELNVQSAKNDYDEAVIERDRTAETAAQKFSKREKELQKMKDLFDPDAESYEAALASDKKAAAEAAERLPAVKEDVNTARKALSAANAELKAAAAEKEKRDAILSEINGILSEKEDDAALFAEAKAEAEKYVEIFGKGNFYMELQYHGIPEEAVCYPADAKIAEELDIPLIASNDVHIMRKTPEERTKRAILRSLRFGEKFESENAGDAELYMKKDSELAEALLEILPEDVVFKAMNNIHVVFGRCNVPFHYDKHYPKFIPEDADEVGKTADEIIENRLHAAGTDEMSAEYKARLKRELGVIEGMHYSDYHLVVYDYITYGRLLGYVPTELIPEAPLTINGLKAYIKEHGWRNPGMTIGNGRGSAVGSLVCDKLKITSLDPIRYGLLFERFLNPERVSMPDIDVDFSNAIRQKCIEYVKHKYGEMAVCGIMTVTKQAPKGAIRIAAKFYGLWKYNEPMTQMGNRLADEVPTDVGVSFKTKVTPSLSVSDDDDAMTLYDQMRENHKSEKDAWNILHWAEIIEGSVTAYGAHAAGIVIADVKDLSDYIPLRWNSKLGLFTTQMDMVQVEEDGFLKFDFLGLRTLDVITDTMKMVEEDTGTIIDPYSLDIEDQNVYREIFQKGNTDAVFQFESPGMKNMLKRFKPSCFEDLVILVSMFRPGPLQYLDGVIDVKNHLDAEKAGK